MPRFGIVWAVDTEAVHRCGMHVGYEAVPEAVRVFGQCQSLELAIAVGCE